MTTWNPRYVAYARAHGRTPEAQREHDEDRWPGGRMAGFMCWMRERWGAWRTLHGRRRDDILTDEDQADFDAYIDDPARGGKPMEQP